MKQIMKHINAIKSISSRTCHDAREEGILKGQGEELKNSRIGNRKGTASPRLKQIRVRKTVHIDSEPKKYQNKMLMETQRALQLGQVATASTRRRA